MKSIKLFLLIVGCAFFASCASYTRGELYSKMYEEKPLTLLVMPPINRTTNVDAKDFLYTSITKPLAEAGYYVISPHLAMEIFKNESAYDAELFLDNVKPFGQVFGADAVVFSIIDQWKKKGFGIQTKLTYIVKSTHTNDVLFERTCDLYLDLSHNSGSTNLVAVAIDLAVSAAATAMTDHIVAARECNEFIFKDIPRGKYHPAYQQDRGVKSEAQNVKKRIKN